ncbi:MAG TPA: hypothetical protein VJ810_20760, partial [Blastocatellia bacterium]|nr:hypothetical protein [Blastocatellia bacterium]
MFTTRRDHQTVVTAVAGLAPAPRRPFIPLVMLLLSLTSSALAQNSVQFKDWKPSLNDNADVKPKRDCGALVSLTGFEFSIETATLVPASGD